jgi:glycosyltransferase involved in cell wall biosynthesis
MTVKAPASEARVLYAATYYVGEYVRQSVILQNLRERPNTRVDVVVVNRRGWTRFFEFLWKFIWLDKSRYHFIYLGWRTIELAPILRWCTRRPLILDAFVPIYETLCHERKTFGPKSLIGRFVRWWERLALQSVSRVVTDTKANAEYFSEEYRIDRDRFVDVPVGVDRSIYFIHPKVTPHQGIRVFFYGTFLPLHGVTVMIEAAHLLRDRDDIVWQLVGDGPERARAEMLAKKYIIVKKYYITLFFLAKRLCNFIWFIRFSF